MPTRVILIVEDFSLFLSYGLPLWYNSRVEIFQFFSLRKEYIIEYVASLAILRRLSVVDVIVTLHQYNVYLVLAATLITAIWGLVLFFTKREVPKAWRTALIITACLALLQGLFGVGLVALGQRPGRASDPLYYLHYVYGAIVALGVPVAFTYATGGKNPRRDVLIFSIALVIIFAAGIRAFVTGPH
jgi:hypothetical protein